MWHADCEACGLEAGLKMHRKASGLSYIVRPECLISGLLRWCGLVEYIRIVPHRLAAYFPVLLLPSY